MADAIVSSSLQKLADVALNKGLEIYQISDQVRMIQRELNLIKAFLRDADSKRKTNDLVKQWVNEIRDVAYRIEDVMDTFLVEVKRPKSFGCFSKLATAVMNPIKLCELSGELKQIVQTLKTIYDRTNNLNIKDLGAGSEERTFIPVSPSKLPEIDDSEVIGFDSDRQHIINHLLDKSISRRIILSIVGIGGLGKTTRAKKVYLSAELDENFECRAWLSISQKFNLTNLLREILYSIEPHMEKSNTPVRDEDLTGEIQKSLGRKKYLIVLDDVWTDNLWERLRTVLPDKANGSRVLLTSRSLDVATAADCNTKPYRLRYLEEDESLALLFRKACQKHILPENYPPDLIEVAKQLTKKCGRLPLALIALGGILSKRERTFAAWQRVEQTLNWHNDEGDKCSQILAMSYTDLPYRLKSCFLYFASFPENYKISAKYITRMWVAEGFIPNDGEGTLEDRAEDFLEELVRRCLVQVVEKSWNGYCKYCIMHDLLRDLAIHESKENNFFTVFSKQGDGNQPAPNVVRRAAIQFCTSTGYSVCSTNTRCLLYFENCISNYEGFRLLRVLVIEYVDMNREKVAWKNSLKGLVHLRYLGFRNCQGMRGFQNISFSTFKNLETLDCKGTYLGNNHSLWKVSSLRHVTFDNHSDVHCPIKWDGLKNLQTLKWVKLADIPNLECNINLRTLKISNSRQYGSVEEAWQRLKTLLSRTENLVSLAIISSDDGFVPVVLVGTRDIPCHEKIQSLYLRGKCAIDVCVPCVEMFPKKLTKLKLECSELEEDPMPIIERLQSLRILELLMKSYMGTKMICSTGGFPNLQKLKLQNLPNLSQWEIKEGAMPILNQLKIRRCDELHTLPELQNVPSLQELEVYSSSDELHGRLQSEDLYKTKHIAIRLYFKTNVH